MKIIGILNSNKNAYILYIGINRTIIVYIREARLNLYIKGKEL